LMTMIHANRGSILNQAYAYLAGPGVKTATLSEITRGALTHPSRPFSQLWGNRLNFWANLSPSGLLGLATPWGLAVVLTVLLPSSLWNGHAFSQPSFQNFPAYPFVVVGSLLVLGRLGARRSWAAYAAVPLALAMAGMTVAWAWVWLPLYPPRYLAVTPAGGRALATARAIIPPGAAVVASQAISGRLAERAKIYIPLSFPIRIPLDGQSVYFVLTTTQGASYLPQDTEGMMAQLAGLNAHLMFQQAGIWVFRWDPPSKARSIVFEGATSGIGAWTFRSSAGAPVTTGDPTTWRMQGDDRSGFVLWGAYWTEPVGSYTAALDLAVKGPLEIHVWEPETGKVLAIYSLTGTGQRQRLEVPFSLGKPQTAAATGVIGRGPFKIQSYPGSSGTLVEVQVMKAASTSVSLYTVGVRPAT
jgi:hypothetical protein